MPHLTPLPGSTSPDPEDPRYESGEIVAICRLEHGRLVVEEAAYLRVTAGLEGCMIAAAPIGPGDEPDTVTLGGESTYRPLDAARGCSISKSRFLRRLFGKVAPRVEPPESIGDLLARRITGS